MVNKKIGDYLRKGRLEDRSISSLKGDLLEDGYDSQDIDEAIYSLSGDEEKENKITKKISKIKFSEVFRDNISIFLRLSIGLLSITFGVIAILHPQLFPSKFLSFLGVIPILSAGFLLLGFFVRYSLLVLCLYFFTFAFLVYASNFMVLYFIISVFSLARSFFGEDRFCLPELVKKK